MSRIGRLAVTALVAAAAACGGGNGDGGPPERVEGEIIALDVEGRALRGMTVRDFSGETYELVIDQNIDYGVGVEHLREHRRLRAPVSCDVEQRNGKLVALTIEDV